MKNSLKENTEWFVEWFDSPYYHVLYKDRNHEEAKHFIDHLIHFINPSKNNLLLDVACGKGRHAIYLNELGYKVDGFDLSENNIKLAKTEENNTLHFYTNDIRHPLKVNHYDVAFNLFTSFGYFDSNKENQLAINAIANSLKDGGILVLDFMNSHKAINQLSEAESIKKNNILFKINKEYKQGYIIKDIQFTDQNKAYHFQEKVKAITYDDFKSYFANANLTIEHKFGDYKLTPFDITTSDRLILVARKQ